MTLATGPWIKSNYRLAKRSISGFTLLELLVVLFIIGLISTLAVLSIGTRSPPNIQEAQRLAALFRLAAEESILYGQELGWLVTERGYSFLVLGEEGWVPVDDDMLRPRPLLGITVKLFLDGPELQVALPASNKTEPAKVDPKQTDHKKKKDEDVLIPQVMLLSSGEVTPFQLQLVGPGLPPWRVTGSYSGLFRAEPVDHR